MDTIHRADVVSFAAGASDAEERHFLSETHSSVCLFYHKSVNLVHMGVVNYLDKYSCLEAAVLPHSVNLILILQCFVTVGSVI